ncbi:ROK family protein [Methylocapsa palsarum]|uniref:Polyphosphate glucokinase n=1 Tax=Methylocapsa palsarum TaxID=1612308 RepID=A0A1I4DCU4_9HYPH|nr:ROK family protein [Methylocapsa palsarum]SFK89751.1 polyphosphate glucokinase [Methylocapsa palsarum]
MNANARTGHTEQMTLAIDIGGSHLKAAILDESGAMSSGPVRVKTPKPATPEAIVATLMRVTHRLGQFDRVSIGFPGVVRTNFILTAPNLGTKAWRDFRLGAVMTSNLGKPVRVLNDASIQGLGVITGCGLECVLTMGTGMGFALFQDGEIAPHLELSQHPIRTHTTYDDHVGKAALERIGRRRWNKRIGKIISVLETVVNYDTLFIGGGNAKLIDIALPANVKLASNAAGITGGLRLWDQRMDHAFTDRAAAFYALSD